MASTFHFCHGLKLLILLELPYLKGLTDRTRSKYVPPPVYVPRYVPPPAYVPRYVPEPAYVPRYVPEPAYVPQYDDNDDTGSVQQQPQRNRAVQKQHVAPKLHHPKPQNPSGALDNTDVDEQYSIFNQAIDNSPLPNDSTEFDSLVDPPTPESVLADPASPDDNTPDPIANIDQDIPDLAQNDPGDRNPTLWQQFKQWAADQASSLKAKLNSSDTGSSPSSPAVGDEFDTASQSYDDTVKKDGITAFAAGVLPVGVAGRAAAGGKIPSQSEDAMENAFEKATTLPSNTPGQ
jgi:hypothetical protein